MGGSLLSARNCCRVADWCVSNDRIVASVVLAASVWLEVVRELVVGEAGAVSFNLHGSIVDGVRVSAARCKRRFERILQLVVMV